MAKKRQKSRVSVGEKELKAVVEKLRAQLAAAERSAEKWRSKAKDNKSVAAGVKRELTALRRRLEKSEASVRKWKERARPPAPVMAPATAAPAPTAPATDAVVRVPDDSWTVAELRTEARARGLVGYSRKTKAELLGELGG